MKNALTRKSHNLRPIKALENTIIAFSFELHYDKATTGEFLVFLPYALGIKPADLIYIEIEKKRKVL